MILIHDSKMPISLSQVLMTTGLDETLRLHQIDGVHNPKIQSVAFERFPIHRSALTIDGSSAVLTSKKPWFKIYDMMTGSTTHVPSIKGGLGGCRLIGLNLVPGSALKASNYSYKNHIRCSLPSFLGIV